MDFIAIDFETANNDLNSACSLGMVFVKENVIVEEQYYLIQPPTLSFHPKNIAIHGIKPEDVMHERKFDEVWQEISKYFDGTTIVAHNAFFDMSVLKACLKEYQLEYPDFPYICSIPISNRATRGYKVGQSLKKRTAFFDIQLLDHHNALEDAKACAKIVIKSIESKKQNSLESFCKTYNTIPIKNFAELKVTKSFTSAPTKRKTTRAFTPGIKISDLTANTEEFDENHPLFGKSFVFTGELQSIDKKMAMQTILDLGAHVKSGVSKKTDYLVVGIQDQKIVGPNGMSTKETKAIDLIHQGVNIEMITEEEFLGLLNGKPKP